MGAQPLLDQIGSEIGLNTNPVPIARRGGSKEPFTSSEGIDNLRDAAKNRSRQVLMNLRYSK